MAILLKLLLDIEKEIMAIGGELHADEEWIEFDSMINLRPLQGNKSKGVYNQEIQKK